MKLLITNIVALNGGDGAILFGMIRIFKSVFGDDCEIRIYCSETEATQRIFPEVCCRETIGLRAVRVPFAKVRFVGRILRSLKKGYFQLVSKGMASGRFWFGIFLTKELRESFYDYATADLLVSSGGTYLKEEYGMMSQLCDYRISLNLKRPLVFFTQSMGPFVNSENRKRLREVFLHALVILLRDQKSAEHVRTLGLPDTSVLLCADAAFSLGDQERIVQARDNVGLYAPKRVIVSVRKWKHFKSCSNELGWERYRRAVAAAVTLLVKKGCSVTFLSTCQGIPEYDDDSLEAEEVVKYLKPNVANQIHIENRFIRHDELLVQLRDFDMCIGTRMHMCILSLISGVPVLPIAYEFKTYELFRDLSLSEWVSDIEDIDANSLSEKVEHFIGAVPELRSSLFAGVLSLCNSSNRAGEYIRSAYEGQR